MKTVTIPFFILLLIGLGCSESKKSNVDIKKLDSSLISFIDNYYKRDLGGSIRLEKSTTDSLVDLIYYHVPNKEDDYDGLLIHITIPLVQGQGLFGANGILEGDINEDGEEELIISVHSEGTGNMTTSQDLFIFKPNQDHFDLISVIGDNGVFRDAESFRPIAIQNKKMIGICSAFADSDAYCCPSIHYKVICSLDKDRLRTESGEKITEEYYNRISSKFE